MGLPFLPLIGLDIGASAIHALELSGKNEKRKLAAIGLQLLSPGAVVKGIIHEAEVVEDALLKLLEKMKVDPRLHRASLALRGDGIEIKRVLMDLNNSDIDEQIEYEVEQHMQMPLDEMYFQYWPMKNWSEDPSKTPVLLVGASQELVDQSIDVLKNVGLKVGVIDCAPLCLANSFFFNYPDNMSLVALVDLGASASSFSLVCNGQFLFTRDLQFSGNEITLQISQQLGIEFDNAEAMKISLMNQGMSTPEPVQQILDAAYHQLVEEIQNSLELYFENSLPIPGINGLGGILLSGGCAGLRNLDQTIANSLGVTVQLLNPFQRIYINDHQFDMNYILAHAHSYAAAVGVALRRFADTPEELLGKAS